MNCDHVTALGHRTFKTLNDISSALKDAAHLDGFSILRSGGNKMNPRYICGHGGRYLPQRCSFVVGIKLGSHGRWQLIIRNNTHSHSQPADAPASPLAPSLEPLPSGSHSSPRSPRHLRSPSTNDRREAETWDEGAEVLNLAAEDECAHLELKPEFPEDVLARRAECNRRMNKRRRVVDEDDIAMEMERSNGPKLIRSVTILSQLDSRSLEDDLPRTDVESAPGAPEETSTAPQEDTALAPREEITTAPQEETNTAPQEATTTAPREKTNPDVQERKENMTGEEGEMDESGTGNAKRKEEEDLSSKDIWDDEFESIGFEDPVQELKEVFRSWLGELEKTTAKTVAQMSGLVCGSKNVERAEGLKKDLKNTWSCMKKDLEKEFKSSPP